MKIEIEIKCKSLFEYGRIYKNIKQYIQSKALNEKFTFKIEKKQ